MGTGPSALHADKLQRTAQRITPVPVAESETQESDSEPLAPPALSVATGDALRHALCRPSGVTWLQASAASFVAPVAVAAHAQRPLGAALVGLLLWTSTATHAVQELDTPFRVVDGADRVAIALVVTYNSCLLLSGEHASGAAAASGAFALLTLALCVGRTMQRAAKFRSALHAAMHVTGAAGCAAVLAAS